MSSLSSSAMGDWDFIRCTPGSISNVTVFAFLRLSLPRIICTYMPCNRDKVLFTQSHWISTPRSQHTSPRSVILKYFSSPLLTASNFFRCLLIMSRSSVDTATITFLFGLCNTKMVWSTMHMSKPSSLNALARVWYHMRSDCHRP